MSVSHPHQLLRQLSQPTASTASSSAWLTQSSPVSVPATDPMSSASSSSWPAHGAAAHGAAAHGAAAHGAVVHDAPSAVAVHGAAVHGAAALSAAVHNASAAAAAAAEMPILVPQSPVNIKQQPQEVLNEAFQPQPSGNTLACSIEQGYYGS